MTGRDKVITVRMKAKSFNIIQDYATSRGLSRNTDSSLLILAPIVWPATYTEYHKFECANVQLHF